MHSAVCNNTIRVVAALELYSHEVLGQMDWASTADSLNKEKNSRSAVDR